MPFVLLMTHVRALPRMRAEEMQRQAMVIAYGNGNMSKEDMRGFAKMLERGINGDQRKRRPASNAEIRSLFGGKPS